MKSLMKSKKGSVEDVVLIVFLLFLTAVVFIFVFVLQDKIDTAISPVFEAQATGSSIGITTVSDIFDTSLNYIYLAAFFALMIATAVMAFMTPTHPIFYVFAIITFVGMMIVSAVISNTWASISTANADLVSATNTLTIPNYIMSNLPLISIVIGVIIAIILFSRTNSGGTIPVQ